MTKDIVGTVVQTYTQARFVGATVRLEPKEEMDKDVLLSNSNDDGNFSFEIEALTPGQYVLTDLHPDATLRGTHKQINIDEDKNFTVDEKEIVGRIMLELYPINIVSNAAGLTFLIMILLVLMGLASLYCYLHHLYPARPLPYNEQISRLLDQAKEEASKQEQDFQVVQEKATDARKMFDAICEAGTIDENIVKLNETLFDNLISSIQQTEKEDVLSNLRLLNGSLRKEPSYFWQESPLNLLEMLFWAIAATLIRLAMNAGRFLRRRNFHCNAIPHHVGYFFAVPIMAVLIAFVLSFINIDFKLGENGVSLDFNNVIVSIVLASLVGLTPWRASEFLEKLADTFFTKISSMLTDEEETVPTNQEERKPLSSYPSLKEDIQRSPQPDQDVLITSPPTEEHWYSPPTKTP